MISNRIDAVMWPVSTSTCQIAPGLDLAGLSEPSFPGISWARHWTEPGGGGASPLLSELGSGLNTPAWFPVSNGDMRALIRDGMHLIQNGDGSEELYELDADPDERRNLIDTERGAAIARRLRTRFSK